MLPYMLLCVSYLMAPSDMRVLERAGAAHGVRVVQLPPSRPTQGQCPVLAGIARRNGEGLYPGGILLVRPGITPARADALLSQIADLLDGM